MNKLIKTGSLVVVQLEDGRSFSKNHIDPLKFIELSRNLNDTEWVLRFFNPDYDKYIKETKEFNSFRNDIDTVPFLFFNDIENSVYWAEISPLSLPEDFTKAIVKAYKENNTKALNAYKNFWILLSLNPSEECRKNLWWFLNLHGLIISSSGFFVGYRNAVTTDEKDDEGNTIYTDQHSHTTKISIGHTVSIPREKCDPNNKVMCSSGLHLGGAKWLEQNYYGDTGLVCLVNPYNVTSLPQESTYGKCRCCEYIPIDYAKYDETGHIIPYDVEMGFECKYAAQAIYEGIISIDKERYVIKAPTEVGINNEKVITDNLLQLAKECITSKEYTVVNNA